LITVEAVRDRILQLRHDMSINRLASVCALPLSSVQNILYGKSRDPKLQTQLKLTRQKLVIVAFLLII